jgi:hypothetical protein
MFAAPDDSPVTSQSGRSRHIGGTVRALKDTFSDVERQYEALRESSSPQGLSPLSSIRRLSTLRHSLIASRSRIRKSLTRALKQSIAENAAGDSDPRARAPDHIWAATSPLTGIAA